MLRIFIPEISRDGSTCFLYLIVEEIRVYNGTLLEKASMFRALRVKDAELTSV